MWTDYVIQKILSLRGPNLKDYFDELSLDFVIPKLIQYVRGNTECENVIWLMASEFNRLSASQGRLDALEDEQLLNRHIDTQSIQEVSDATLLSYVLKFSNEKTMPQHFAENDKAVILIPILNKNAQLPMAYILITGASLRSANKIMAINSRDIGYMTKHIGFSIQHWEAEKGSFVDDLTGLYNQKYMSLVLENEIHRTQREKEKFSVLFMDVDYFKSVNDSRGHWVGSRLLVEVGRIVKETVRKSDYAFRYGGDEFVLVLPHTGSEKAVIAAERIRTAIEKTDFIIDGEQIKLTLSIGLATFPDHAKTYKDIIKMADEAMYCGKNKSRNIVFVAS